MKLESGIKITYEFEVDQKVPPSIGDCYLDQRGRKWYVRGVGPEQGIKLRDPPPTYSIWSVRFESDHPAYTLGVGEVIKPIYERRLYGTIERSNNELQGFGHITTRDSTYSWIMRTNGDSWLIRIGPQVVSFSHFSTILYEKVGIFSPNQEEFPWDLVEGVLTDFVTQQYNLEQ